MSFVDHKSKFSLRKAEWFIGFHIGNFKTEKKEIVIKSCGVTK